MIRDKRQMTKEGEEVYLSESRPSFSGDKLPFVGR